MTLPFREAEDTGSVCTESRVRRHFYLCYADSYFLAWCFEKRLFFLTSIFLFLVCAVQFFVFPFSTHTLFMIQPPLSPCLPGRVSSSLHCFWQLWSQPRGRRSTEIVSAEPLLISETETAESPVAWTMQPGQVLEEREGEAGHLPSHLSGLSAPAPGQKVEAFPKPDWWQESPRAHFVPGVNPDPRSQILQGSDPGICVPGRYFTPDKAGKQRTRRRWSKDEIQKAILDYLDSKIGTKNPGQRKHWKRQLKESGFQLG